MCNVNIQIREQTIKKHGFTRKGHFILTKCGNLQKSMASITYVPMHKHTQIIILVIFSIFIFGYNKKIGIKS